MPWLIGTDEAGYGPNLGPLVVTGTLWEVSNLPCDLYKVLERAVSRTAESDRMTLADSKALYKPGGSLRKLEENILGLVSSCSGRSPSTAEELFRFLGSVPNPEPASIWQSAPAIRIPVDSAPTTIEMKKQLLDGHCSIEQVKIAGIRTAVLMPDEFNRRLIEQGNKANVLAMLTMQLVRDLLEVVGSEVKKRAHANSGPSNSTAPAAVHVACDKLGGRNRYASVLQQFLTSSPVRVLGESAEVSCYRYSDVKLDVSIEFRTKGESQAPVAAASMVSKYIRELYMDSWNGFWINQVPDLKPTRGYPQDARRFWREIEEHCSALNIQREQVWRMK